MQRQWCLMRTATRIPRLSFSQGKTQSCLQPCTYRKTGGEFIFWEMILHWNLMKLEKAFTGEHMEALLAWNYILSQSCLQMNIFWLLTQSQVAACLTQGRVYIAQVQGINRQFELFFPPLTQVPICEWWHLRGIGKKSGCSFTHTNNQTGRKTKP